MRLRAALLTGLVLCTGPIGCSDPSGPSEAAEPPGLLAGAWEATVFEFTGDGPAPAVRDLVREGSGVLFQVAPEGGYRLILSRADGTEMEEEGTLLRHGESLRFQPSLGSEWTAVHTVNQVQAVLDARIRGADLDGDGVGEEGSLRVVLERLQVGDLSDLVGTWTAVSFTFHDLEDFVIHEDIIPQGAFFTIRFRPEGLYTAVSSAPGHAPTHRVGSVQRFGSVLLMSGLRNLNENDIEVHLIDGQMELTHCDDLWDFDRDGGEEEGTLTLLLVPIEPTLLEEVAGTWDATRYEYVSLAHAERLTDLVGRGYGITIRIGADRSFVETVTEPGGAASVRAAQVSLLGQVLIITPTDQTGPRYLTSQREPGILYLRTAAEAWDFLGTGEREPARLYIRLVPGD